MLTKGTATTTELAFVCARPEQANNNAPKRNSLRALETQTEIVRTTVRTDFISISPSKGLPSKNAGSDESLDKKTERPIGAPAAIVYRSESVSDRDLHFSRIASQAAPVFADGQRIHYSEIAVIVSIASGLVIVDGVCKILNLQPHLQVLPLCDSDLLGNRHAQVLVTGQSEKIPPDVTELAR